MAPIKTKRKFFTILFFIIAPFQMLTAQTGPVGTVCEDVKTIINVLKTERLGNIADFAKPLPRGCYESKWHLRGFEKGVFSNEYSISKIESLLNGSNAITTKKIFDKLTAVLKDCYPTYKFESEVKENYEVVALQEMDYHPARILIEYYSAENKVKLSVIKLL